MQKRKSTKSDIDITKPIAIPKDDGTCYGKEYDISCSECVACSDNLSCSIIYGNKVVDKFDADMEAKNGKYLSQANFDFFTDKWIDDNVISGTSSENFIQDVMTASGFKDTQTVVLHVKRYAKETGKLKFKEGKVWIQ